MTRRRDRQLQDWLDQELDRQLDPSINTRPHDDTGLSATAASINDLYAQEHATPDEQFVRRLEQELMPPFAESGAPQTWKHERTTAERAIRWPLPRQPHRRIHLTRLATVLSTALLIAMIGAAAFFAVRINAPSNPTPSNFAAISPAGTPAPTATLAAATPAPITDPEKLPPGVDWALRLGIERPRFGFGGMAYADGRVFRLVSTEIFTGVEAVNAEHGAVEWRIATDWSGQGITAGNQGVYFTTTPTTLAALDPTSGAELWRKSFSQPVVSMALHDNLVESEDKTLYVWDQSSTMTAIDVNTGETAWQTTTLDTGGPQSTAAGTTRPEVVPAVGERTVVMVAADGTVNAFDRATGEIAWSVPDFDPVNTKFAINFDILFVLSGDLHMTGTGIDLNTGEVIWQIGVDGPLRQPVASSEHYFYLIGNDVTDTSDIAPASTPIVDYSDCCSYWPGSAGIGDESAQGGSHVFGLDMNTGEVLWSRSTKAGGFDALITTFPQSGALRAITSDGYVIQLAREYGGILPEPMQLGGNLYTAISGGVNEASDIVGYFATLTDGSLVSFGAVPQSEQG